MSQVCGAQSPRWGIICTREPHMPGDRVHEGTASGYRDVKWIDGDPVEYLTAEQSGEWFRRYGEDTLMMCAEAKRRVWGVDEVDRMWKSWDSPKPAQRFGSNSEDWVLAVIVACVVLIPIGLPGFVFMAGLMGVQ